MSVARAFAHPPNIEPQEPEGFVREQVHHVGLLHVQLDPKRCEIFLEALQGPCCPAPFGVVSTHGDDDIICEPMIVHRLIRSLCCFTSNRIKGPVDLIQI